MKAVLVGAGNLATQLGLALQRAGYAIAQVYSRTEASAAALAGRLDSPYTTSIESLISDADLYIVALKDSALEALIPAITQGKSEQALFVHTAGSMPMRVWEKGSAHHFGVFYPMQTFSKQREVDFSTIPIFVEANSASALAGLKTVGASLSGTVMEADSEQRRSLHLSAVFVCNFANHMYTIGERLLQECGIPFEVMHPLLRETAAKVLGGMEPSKAQTGPAVRYDENVINKHLQSLAAYPEWQQLYQKISESIHHDKLRSEKD